MIDIIDLNGKVKKHENYIENLVIFQKSYYFNQTNKLSLNDFIDNTAKEIKELIDKNYKNYKFYELPEEKKPFWSAISKENYHNIPIRLTFGISCKKEKGILFEIAIIK